MEIPRGVFMKIEGRSGLASNGIYPIGGVIDSDYRGEIQVILRNSSQTDVALEPGTRIAQLILLPRQTAEWELVSWLNPTKRACHGFGSTGLA